MGDMASGSAMGAVFRMVVPRLLVDMDGVSEDQLGRMLDVLAERLHYVRTGEAPQAPQTADEAAPDAQVDEAPNADPVTT